MSLYHADLHVHTSASDDGRSDLNALARAAKERGLDAIAITDHNLCTHCPESIAGVLLIPGCEISTPIGHITGLFLESPVDLESLGPLPAPEAAVAAIRSAGGAAVLAHPFQRSGAHEELFSFDMDGIETANARADMKVSNANEKAAAFARNRNLPQIGGSDAHDQAEVGNAYTRLECESRSLSAFRQALLSGNTTPVLCKKTTHWRKGLSQWTKARKSASPLRVLRGAAYLCYCAFLDITKR